jgi:hypothetical protein
LQYYNTSGIPYQQSDFNSIATSGYNGVEVIVPWTVETSPGKYNFTVLNAYLGYARHDGLGVVLVFWFTGWTFGVTTWVPSWITSQEVDSQGAKLGWPSWWDPVARSDYFGLVNATVSDASLSPTLAGVYVTYGVLDYPWGSSSSPSSAVPAGYSPDDVRVYDDWLPTRYASLSAYNSVWGTDYASWGAVPPPTPGGPGWYDFEEFRLWSVNETFSEISVFIRARTTVPLLYYFGGDVASTPMALNDPAIDFAVARKYGGIVNLDDANSPELVDLFAGLAAAYRVPFIQEWTPNDVVGGHLNATLANGLDGEPWSEGADFFTYDPTSPMDSAGLPWQGELRPFFDPRLLSPPPTRTAVLLGFVGS